MEERVTGKDLWYALQIIQSVEDRIDAACKFKNCDDCPLNGLFDIEFCAEMEDIDSEDRAKLWIKMLEKMEE